MGLFKFKIKITKRYSWIEVRLCYTFLFISIITSSQSFRSSDATCIDRVEELVGRWQYIYDVNDSDIKYTYKR